MRHHIMQKIEKKLKRALDAGSGFDFKEEKMIMLGVDFAMDVLEIENVTKILEERKPREFWISLDAIGNEGWQVHKSKPEFGEWIRVREILD